MNKKRRNENSAIIVLAKASKLLKMFKAVKFLKPLITLSSLVVSTVAYAFTLPGGWIFAIGFVVMLLIHEMGHVLALRRKGMKASAPVFIPFVGAAIFAPKLGDRDQEAYVGYAGPLVGGTAALILLGAVAFVSHPPVILSLIAYVALFINVFNMLPISPLDGGRITQAIGPWFKWVGAALLIALTIATSNPGLMLIWLLTLGNFPMDRRIRALLGVIFWGTMAFMQLGGIGAKEGTVWILVDLIVGFLFAAAYVFLALTKEPEEIVRDERPQLERKRKFFWLAMYALLTIVLLVMTIVSHGYLPVGHR